MYFFTLWIDIKTTQVVFMPYLPSSNVSASSLGAYGLLVYSLFDQDGIIVTTYELSYVGVLLWQLGEQLG